MVEAIRFQETEVLDRKFGESVRIVDDGDGDYERERMRSTAYPEAKERTLMGFYADGTRDQERVRSPVYPEVKERNASSLYDEEARSMSSEGRFSGPQLHQQGVVESSERPKLKLLARTKPLEPSSDARGIDDNKVFCCFLKYLIMVTQQSYQLLVLFWIGSDKNWSYPLPQMRLF